MAVRVPTDEEWSRLVAHLAACDRRYRRAAGRLRRTGEGAADVLATLDELTEAARACAQASPGTLSRRHFSRLVQQCETRAEER
jgi:hypothetical protein